MYHPDPMSGHDPLLLFLRSDGRHSRVILVSALSVVPGVSNAHCTFSSKLFTIHMCDNTINPAGATPDFRIN
jgi:hypothetical protein